MPNAQTPRTVRGLIKRLDPFGAVAFTSVVICLLLALQWGGTKYEWKSGRMIALFVLFGVLLLGFVALERHLQDNATVPPSIIGNRGICSCAVYQFTLGAGFFIFIYYVPIWFQAVQGIDATQSGLRVLPMLIGNIVATVLAGGFVSSTGRFVLLVIFMILGTILTSIGGGLISLFNPTTSTAEWICYQALVGVGVGWLRMATTHSCCPDSSWHT